jgi:hypothetical protein
MNAFQIWDKLKPPPDPYLGYMKSIRDMSDQYILIGQENFMGRDFVSFDSVYQSLPDDLRNRTNGSLKIFDAIRCFYLAHHFGMAYFDIDIELTQPIKILDIVQMSGPGVLVGNGDAALGLQCWQDYLAYCKNFGCRPASLLFGKMKKGKIIESGFKHHYAQGNYFNA